MKTKEQRVMFEYDEDLLAVAAGVARGFMGEARGKCLKRGAEWDVCCGRVLLAREGVEKVLRVLGMEYEKKGADGVHGMEGVLNAARQKTLPDAGEIRVRVVVIPTNPALVIGVNMTSKKEEMVRVLVGQNGNFTLGMEMPAKKVPGTDADVFALVGEKPRSRGRW
jgi:hypothetical protein